MRTVSLLKLGLALAVTFSIALSACSGSGGSPPPSRSFVTGLAAGKYCDVLGGGANAGACVGQMVIVGADGRATVSLAANTALVLQTGVSVP